MLNENATNFETASRPYKGKCKTGTITVGMINVAVSNSSAFIILLT